MLPPPGRATAGWPETKPETKTEREKHHAGLLDSEGGRDQGPGRVAGVHETVGSGRGAVRGQDPQRRRPARRARGRLGTVRDRGVPVVRAGRRLLRGRGVPSVAAVRAQGVRPRPRDRRRHVGRLEHPGPFMRGCGRGQLPGVSPFPDPGARLHAQERMFPNASNPTRKVSACTVRRTFFQSSNARSASATRESTSCLVNRRDRS